MTNANTTLLCAMTLVTCILTTACRVESHKDGNDDNVKIATPFGGMSVKTNNSVVQSNVGLSLYPNASLVTKDKDNGAADVSMNFGSFHLGVKALSYRTSDSPEKVLAFYRKDMARYGAVVLCKDNQAVGAPQRTQDGLSCSSDSQGSVHTDESGNAGELKAGSKQHQHIVSVDREGSGSKFGLVALDLPGHISKDDETDKQ